MGLTLALLGLSLYLLLWWDHEVAPGSASHAAPPTIRRVLRRGGGPLVVGAAVVQVAAVCTLVAGVLMQLAVLTPVASRIVGNVVLGCWVVAAFVFVLLPSDAPSQIGIAMLHS